ncbi:hypothetical protein HGM15179_018716 [Zosterops borbonicus]|uniref:Uncharacterized protein n=1 Tax=Zosterops borbonicus TaxID=364589 RepID=A0A8K1DBL0_9PASS|nr:hypothetical protein HGM15179_018716 [Zosterops borbonicus]
MQETLRGLRGENARLEGTLRNLSRALGALRARLRDPPGLGDILRNLWAKEPVIVASFGIAAVVPVRDNRNLPKVPKISPKYPQKIP